MRPSTLYYMFVQFLYNRGFRPKPESLFYSQVLANEAWWMKGR